MNYTEYFFKLIDMAIEMKYDPSQKIKTLGNNQLSHPRLIFKA